VVDAAAAKAAAEEADKPTKRQKKNAPPVLSSDPIVAAAQSALGALPAVESRVPIPLLPDTTELQVRCHVAVSCRGQHVRCECGRCPSFKTHYRCPVPDPYRSVGFCESRHLESRPKASARLDLEVSAGWANPSSRGMWGGDAVLLSISLETQTKPLFTHSHALSPSHLVLHTASSPLVAKGAPPRSSRSDTTLPSAYSLTPSLPRTGDGTKVLYF
jgi:hypothetical protein